MDPTEEEQYDNESGNCRVPNSYDAGKKESPMNPCNIHMNNNVMNVSSNGMYGGYCSSHSISEDGDSFDNNNNNVQKYKLPLSVESESRQMNVMTGMNNNVMNPHYGMERNNMIHVNNGNESGNYRSHTKMSVSSARNTNGMRKRGKKREKNKYDNIREFEKYINISNATNVSSLRVKLWEALILYINNLNVDLIEFIMKCLDEIEFYWGSEAMDNLNEIKSLIQDKKFKDASNNITEMLSSLSVVTGKTIELTPFFYTLVVSSKSNKQNSYNCDLTCELKKILSYEHNRLSNKNIHQKVEYKIIEVNNAREALLACLINSQILSVVIVDNLTIDNENVQEKEPFTMSEEKNGMNEKCMNHFGKNNMNKSGISGASMQNGNGSNYKGQRSYDSFENYDESVYSSNEHYSSQVNSYHGVVHHGNRNIGYNDSCYNENFPINSEERIPNHQLCKLSKREKKARTHKKQMKHNSFMKTDYQFKVENFVLGYDKLVKVPIEKMKKGFDILVILIKSIAYVRRSIDIFCVCTSITLEKLHTINHMIIRIFTTHDDHSDLHESILDGVKKKIKTPFFNALKSYAERPIGVFHALAISKGNSVRRSRWIQSLLDFYGLNLFKAESSATCGGLDSLLDPHGSLKEAQIMAARAYGSKYCFFVTNGTSSSNKIVMQALVKPGDIILVDRACHKSHHYGFVLTQSFPCYLDPYPISRYGIYGAVPIYVIKKTLLQYRDSGKLHLVKLLILTNCTFDGIVYNVKRVMEECLAIKPDLIFLFDEAWFAYACFHPILKFRTAMSVADRLRNKAQKKLYYKMHKKLLHKLGNVKNLSQVPADQLLKTRLYPNSKEYKVRVYATQSIHKSLTSLRQGSVILISDDNFESDAYVPFKEAYFTHMSTSPNYQILATLDAGRAQMELEGYALVEKQIEAALLIRKELNEDPIIFKYFRTLNAEDMIPDTLRQCTISDQLRTLRKEQEECFSYVISTHDANWDNECGSFYMKGTSKEILGAEPSGYRLVGSGSRSGLGCGSGSRSDLEYDVETESGSGSESRFDGGSEVGRKICEGTAENTPSEMLRYNVPNDSVYLDATSRSFSNQGNEMNCEEVHSGKLHNSYMANVDGVCRNEVVVSGSVYSKIDDRGVEERKKKKKRKKKKMEIEKVRNTLTHDSAISANAGKQGYLGRRQVKNEKSLSIGSNCSSHFYEYFEKSWLSEDEFVLDPTRITLFTGYSGIDGDTFKVKWLMDKYGIQINKTSINTVLFQTNIGTTGSSCLFLKSCLYLISQELDQKKSLFNERDLHQFNESVNNLVSNYIELSEFSMFHPLFKKKYDGTDVFTREGDLRKAFYLAYEENYVEYILLDDLKERMKQKEIIVSASFIIPYPPGFPILVPGQIMSQEIVDNLSCLSVKEIHGYDENKGFRCFCNFILNYFQNTTFKDPTDFYQKIDKNTYNQLRYVEMNRKKAIEAGAESINDATNPSMSLTNVRNRVEGIENGNMGYHLKKKENYSENESKESESDELDVDDIEADEEIDVDEYDIQEGEHSELVNCDERVVHKGYPGENTERVNMAPYSKAKCSISQVNSSNMQYEGMNQRRGNPNYYLREGAGVVPPPMIARKKNKKSSTQYNEMTNGFSCLQVKREDDGVKSVRGISPIPSSRNTSGTHKHGLTGKYKGRRMHPKGTKGNHEGYLNYPIHTAEKGERRGRLKEEVERELIYKATNPNNGKGRNENYSMGLHKNTNHSSYINPYQNNVPKCTDPCISKNTHSHRVDKNQLAENIIVCAQEKNPSMVNIINMNNDMLAGKANEYQNVENNISKCTSPFIANGGELSTNINNNNNNNNFMNASALSDYLSNHENDATKIIRSDDGRCGPMIKQLVPTLKQSDVALYNKVKNGMLGNCTYEKGNEKCRAIRHHKNGRYSCRGVGEFHEDTYYSDSNRMIKSKGYNTNNVYMISNEKKEFEYDNSAYTFGKVTGADVQSDVLNLPVSTRNENGALEDRGRGNGKVKDKGKGKQKRKEYPNDINSSLNEKREEYESADIGATPIFVPEGGRNDVTTGYVNNANGINNDIGRNSISESKLVKDIHYYNQKINECAEEIHKLQEINKKDHERAKAPQDINTNIKNTNIEDANGHYVPSKEDMNAHNNPSMYVNSNTLKNAINEPRDHSLKSQVYYYADFLGTSKNAFVRETDGENFCRVNTLNNNSYMNNLITHVEDEVGMDKQSNFLIEGSLTNSEINCSSLDMEACNNLYCHHSRVGATKGGGDFEKSKRSGMNEYSIPPGNHGFQPNISINTVTNVKGIDGNNKIHNSSSTSNTP